MEKKGMNLRFSQRSAGNLFKKMKLLTAFFFAGLLGASASSYSQATKLSLKLDETTLKEAFKQIEKTSEFVFFYNEDYVDINRKVNVNVTDESVEAILSDLLGTQNTFKIYDRQIVILPPETKVSPASVKVEAPSQQPQKKEVAGSVKDNKGGAIPGVSVVVKGTTTGTITDADGQFRLPIPNDAKILVFSFVGMKPQELAIAGKTSFSVTMLEEVVGLDEVVAVGYGTQKRKDLTGSFGQVKSEDLTKTAVIGFDQALQGKIAGVQVTNNSGEPGGSVSMRIRGVGSINSTNEPLYIVDGVPYGSLNAINVNDIDRIDVLKDAAAASIYGSRASNGVVLVTTKHAKKGFSVSFDGFGGVQDVPKKISLLNGHQFAQLANENLVNGGITANPMWSSPSTVQDNNWQAALFQPAAMQSYNISISSGGDKSATLFSFGYLDQGGIVVGSSYQRYTIRLNTDYNISDKLKAGIILNTAFDKKQNASSAGDMSSINAAISMAPTTPITVSHEGLFGLNPDGSLDLSGNSFYGYEGYAYHTRFSNVNYFPQNVNNPVGLNKKYLSNPNKDQMILASAFAEYEAIKGLKIKSTISLTFDDGYSQSSAKASPDALNLMAQLKSTSTYSENWSKSTQWNWINTISYNKTIGKHNLAAIAGIDAQKYNYRYVGVSTVNVPAGQESVSASDVDTRIATGYPSTSALLSYFGRLSYDYQGKYLFSGTIRRDGSSNFGPNKQYGVFSSASIGWRISQEEFMKSVEFINDLKLRASFGTVGNQNIPSFKYLSTYSSDAGTYQYTLGPNKSGVAAIYQNNIGDPNIHWEKSKQTDFGFDLSVMKGKLSLTADYYIKQMADLLGNFPVPAFVGVFGNSVLKNGFSMENKGLELAVDYREHIGQVNFSAGANFATLSNKITKLTDNLAAYVSQSISMNGHDGGAITQTKVGGRIGDFIGFKTDGIAQTAAEASSNPLGGLSAGDRKYVDTNKDGNLNASDKVVLGNGLPKYTFGMNLKADYKRFDIAIFLNGQAGVKIANMLRATIYDMRYNNSTGIVNVSSDLMNRWTGAGTSNTMPRNSYTAPISNDWFSDAYIQDGSFVRISNLQIGYTLKENLLNKLGISHVRFYLSGQNLYTFTKYTGYDPEIGSNGQNVLQTGADFGRYPLARMFSVGVNCKF